MIKGFNFIEHIDENSCWVTGYYNVDPHFAYVPNWLYNFTLKRMIYVTIGKIHKECFENEEIKKTMEENKKFWDHVQSRLNEITQSWWLYNIRDYFK